MAFAKHLAGEAMTDGKAGVYIVNRSDPWLARPLVPAVEPIEQRTDADGHTVELFKNDLQQRMVRYLTGPKAGQINYDSSFPLLPAEPQRRAYIADGVSNPYDF